MQTLTRSHMENYFSWDKSGVSQPRPVMTFLCSDLKMAELSRLEKSSVRGHLPRESYRKSEEALCSPDCGRLETLFRISWRWLYLEKVLPKKLTHLLTYCLSQSDEVR